MSHAEVRVNGEMVGRIGPGLLVLVGVGHSDTEADVHWLARKLHGLRILRGETSLADVSTPAALVVSQFTLLGDARKGRRPSWSGAASSSDAEPLVSQLVRSLQDLGIATATGVFGADMAVESINDGPVTLVLDTPHRSDPSVRELPVDLPPG